jgi:putative ABC transport system permease protein
MLAFAGALLGSVLAWNVLGALVAILPEGSLPSEALIRLSDPVLLIALGITLACTLLFGMAPALIAASRDMQEPLKASGRGAGESFRHHRLRNLLVVTEVALSLILLRGAGSLIRSFVALREVKPGFNPDRMFVAGFSLPDKTAEQRDQLHAELLRRGRSLPGVQSAAYGTVVEKDLHGPQGVAVVNQTFFDTYFKGEIPLGRRIKVPNDLGLKLDQPACCEIVGVVADTKGAGPDHPAWPTVFMRSYSGALLVRTVGAPGLVLNPLRHGMAALDKELPIGWARPMQEVMGIWYAEPRFFTTMLVAFASLGLVLVSVGVYGVLSYAVSQRTQEIGVRMALGAQAADMRRMVLKRGLRWLAVGIGIGIPASVGLAKVLQNKIWGIKSADPLTLVGVSLVLTAVGFAACYIPARRATKVDPLVALPHE